MSAESGRVVDYLFVNHKILIPSLKPLITATQAIRLASKHLGLELPPGRVHANLAIMGVHSNQALVWEIVLSKSLIGGPLHRKIRQRGVQSITINARTGAWFNRFKPGKPLDIST